MALREQTLDQLHVLLVKKEISAEELTKATLKDIKEREEKLGNFITVNEEGALEQARQLESHSRHCLPQSLGHPVDALVQELLLH